MSNNRVTVRLDCSYRRSNDLVRESVGFKVQNPVSPWEKEETIGVSNLPVFLFKNHWKFARWKQCGKLLVVEV